MGKTLTEAEVLELLRSQVKYGIKLSDLATKAGVSVSFLSAVLRGRKPPSDKVLALVGIKAVRTTTYVREG